VNPRLRVPQPSPATAIAAAGVAAASYAAYTYRRNGLRCLNHNAVTAVTSDALEA
jgi:hypothetical protein